ARTEQGIVAIDRDAAQTWGGADQVRRNHHLRAVDNAEEAMAHVRARGLADLRAERHRAGLVVDDLEIANSAPDSEDVAARGEVVVDLAKGLETQVGMAEEWVGGIARGRTSHQGRGFSNSRGRSGRPWAGVAGSAMVGGTCVMSNTRKNVSLIPVPFG